jgi:hypothetical protein
VVTTDKHSTKKGEKEETNNTGFENIVSKHSETEGEQYMFTEKVKAKTFKKCGIKQTYYLCPKGKGSQN